MSNEYKAAIEKHDAAQVVFHAAQKAYRNREIGDDAFLAAKAEYDAATAAFDVVYAKEAY